MSAGLAMLDRPSAPSAVRPLYDEPAYVARIYKDIDDTHRATA
jgi:hypothetical protein